VLAGHALPQVPQLALSVFALTQAPEQSVWPVGQTQAPPEQIWVARHALPHLPQLSLSLASDAQVPVQLVRPAAHPLPHEARPASGWPHTGVAPLQATAHAPQLVADVNVVGQPAPVLLQSPNPAAHV
jgi:hypothetical protein